MKKSLLVLAVLGATAMSANAGNVTLYGAVDGGFKYLSTSTSVADETNTVSSFTLADGLAGANKVGIKGEEDIGSVKVGFKLENGFSLANGSIAQGGKLFGREARLYLKSDIGEVSVGRFGGLNSAAGSYDTFFAIADAFDGGDNDVPYGYVKSDRYDNSIAYRSPEVAGVQGTLMYSFQKSGDQNAKFKDNSRYVGAALTFKQEKLALVGSFEAQIRNAQDKVVDLKKDVLGQKNGFTFSLGGNYDLDVAKLYAGAQLSRNSNVSDIKQGVAVFDVAEGTGFVPPVQFNGYAFNLGAKVPFGASDVTLGAYYGSYKNSQDLTSYAANVVHTIFPKKALKLNVVGLNARYTYNLSERTSLFAGTGYGVSQYKNFAGKFKSKVFQAYTGLHHNF